MQPSNLSNKKITDSTTDYFNNFYNEKYELSQNENEVVVSYFEKITGNKASASALAGAMIYTAKSQGLDIMDVIGKFVGLTDNQLTSYLTMFLNLNRVGTSFVGLVNIVPTNKYITRTLLP